MFTSFYYNLILISCFSNDTIGWLTFWKCWNCHDCNCFPGWYWSRNTPKKFSAFFGHFYYMQLAVFWRKQLKFENTYMWSGQLSHTYMCGTPKCAYWWAEQTPQINILFRIRFSPLNLIKLILSRKFEFLHRNE